MLGRHLAVGAILALLVGCNKAEHGGLHKKIPMQNEIGAPLVQNIKASSTILNQQISVNSLQEMFEIDECIKLEAYDIAPLSIITHLVRLGDRFFLNDLSLHQVFQFDLQGHFLGTVGQVGEGPGEYESPAAMAANRNNLIIYDAGRGQYLFYNSNGTFLKKYDGTKNYVTSRTFLSISDELFVLGFSGSSATTPYHAILKIEEKDLEIVTGFGKRPSPAVLPAKRTVDTLNHKGIASFAIVGEHVWVGSPFQTTLEVYDLSGRFVTSLPSGVDGIHLNDLGETPTQDLYNQFQQTKFTHSGLRVVSPWVIAYFTRGQKEHKATIYDFDGNILTSNIPATSALTSAIAQSIDGWLVCPVVLEGWTEKTLNLYLGVQGMKKARASGFEPGSKEEAMFLIFSKPKF